MDLEVVSRKSININCIKRLSLLAKESNLSDGGGLRHDDSAGHAHGAALANAGSRTSN
jgi:hypothetical protein